MGKRRSTSYVLMTIDESRSSLFLAGFLPLPICLLFCFGLCLSCHMFSSKSGNPLLGTYI